MNTWIPILKLILHVVLPRKNLTGNLVLKRLMKNRKVKMMEQLLRGVYKRIIHIVIF